MQQSENKRVMESARKAMAQPGLSAELKARYQRVIDKAEVIEILEEVIARKEARGEK